MADYVVMSQESFDLIKSALLRLDERNWELSRMSQEAPKHRKTCYWCGLDLTDFDPLKVIAHTMECKESPIVRDRNEWREAAMAHLDSLWAIKDTLDDYLGDECCVGDVNEAPWDEADGPEVED